MGIFGSQQNLGWNAITTKEDLDKAIESSFDKVSIIFKHSTRCGVSRMVLSAFEKQFNDDGKSNLYFLDLLEYRNVSNEIASRLNVQHQSPQLIALRNGDVIFQASHDSITSEAVELAIAR